MADKIVTKELRRYSPYKASPEFICHPDKFKEMNMMCVEAGIYGPISDLSQAEKIKGADHSADEEHEQAEVKGLDKEEVED